MAEHWRYQDRLAAQLLTQRPKTELVGYGRGDLGVDERDANYGKAGAAYGSTGLTGADITGLGDGTLLGAGLTGTLRPPTLGLSALEDPRLSGVMSGLLKGASVGLNGATSDIPSGPGPDFRSDLALVLGLIPPDASRTLFVEGLPIDCTRREAAHIFRPFQGYKEVRVTKKGTKEEKRFLCFVEFEDAYSAAKALEALRGYKFDEDDGDSEPLQMRFASICAPRGVGLLERRRRRRRRRSGH